MLTLQAENSRKLSRFTSKSSQRLRTAFGPKDPRTARAMSHLGWSLLKQQKWAAAEAILRECLAVCATTMPELWSTFSTRSQLGESLLGQGRYIEAEEPIVAGYKGLKAREAKLTTAAKPRLTEAADRVTRLYERLGRPGEAAAVLGITENPKSTGKEEENTPRRPKP